MHIIACIIRYTHLACTCPTRLCLHYKCAV